MYAAQPRGVKRKVAKAVAVKKAGFASVRGARALLVGAKRQMWRWQAREGGCMRRNKAARSLSEAVAKMASKTHRAEVVDDAVERRKIDCKEEEDADKVDEENFPVGGGVSDSGRGVRRRGHCGAAGCDAHTHAATAANSSSETKHSQAQKTCVGRLWAWPHERGLARALLESPEVEAWPKEQTRL